MQRISFFAFIVLVVVAVATILATSSGLPDPVATHFGNGGRANGWMSRDGYALFMVVMVVGLALAMWVSMTWLPRVAPRLVNIPNREVWMAGPERAAALASLAGFGMAFSALTSGFLVGLHLLIVAANEVKPATLPQTAFFWLLALFLGGIAVLVVTLTLRFRRRSGRR